MDKLPTLADFEQAERALGCSEVLVREWKPDTVLNDHTHPFGARALVVRVEMWLTLGGQVQHLGPGNRFEVAAGTPHAERYGPEGATYWVARRQPTGSQAPM